ncbi:Uncharacterised protein [Sphingobacterium daejeonense]|nr:Uncharacterised protein [Sphingobacterium daejeonense]
MVYFYLMRIDDPGWFSTDVLWYRRIGLHAIIVSWRIVVHLVRISTLTENGSKYSKEDNVYFICIFAPYTIGVVV